MQAAEINKLADDLSRQLKDIKNEKLAIECRNIFTKKHLAPLYDELKIASNDKKKELGISINLLKNKILEITEERIQQIKSELESANHVINYDIYLNAADLKKGTLTPLSMMANEVISFFKKMNFRIESGDEVVRSLDNFDKLDISKDHPARQGNDSFYIDEDYMLRTHCTATTAKVIANNNSKDIRVLSFGNVYRKDDDDATHSHQFNQIDIVWVKEGLSLQNLKWLVHEMLKYIFGSKVETRFRLSYFPFTEPSFEVDMTCPYCEGKGCPICKQTGWIELLGAGMLHANVLKAANINIKTGLAAGFGIDRLAMIKYGIKDIRDLYSNDFRVLNQFKK